jgi:hypothetical protein
VAIVAVVLLCVPGSARAAGDANQDSCGNEAAAGFSATLPDCRAYEMVSPPYKDGFSIQGPQTFSEADLGAAPLIASSSLGAFAGSPDISSIGNDYLFRRGPSGWETVALDPQPEQFFVNPQVGPTDEYGRLAVSESGASLFALHAPSESAYASNLYLREVDGTLREIGPMLPASATPSQPTGLMYIPEDLHFAGASSDLSRTMFYAVAGEELPEGVTTNLWPGDTTVLGAERPSLYEYDGTGHTGQGGDTPRLVGVDGEGHLISQCGTALGGPPARAGNSHNAISADGETAFFTAIKGGCSGHDEAGTPVTGAGPAADELFVKSAGSATAISVPTSECGAACEGLPAADANFEGASEDGDVAVFSSTQKLLPEAIEDNAEHERFGELMPDDAVENGGCRKATGGGGCNLYGYDRAAQAGHRLFLISTGAPMGAHVQGVAAMSPDGSRVFFVAAAKLTGANREGKAPEEGGKNLYVYTRRCPAGEPGCASPATSLAFVGALAEGDEGQWSATGEEPMDVSPDGRYLLFTSEADLTPDDTSTVPQVFRYDAQSEALVRVSIGEEGFDSAGNTETPGLGAEIQRPVFHGALQPGEDTHPSISDDGETVVFQSPLALTPGALNARSQPGPFGEPVYAMNIYEYERGHVYLISDGQTTIGVPLQFLGALLIGVSADGQDVLFRTYGPLLPQDADTLVDVYDARIDGGFPAAVGQRTGCEGSACQAPTASTPSLASAGSVTQPPGENVESHTVTPRPETKAQKLAAALRKCRKTRVKKKRQACERAVRKKLAPKGHKVSSKKAKAKAK